MTLKKHALFETFVRHEASFHCMVRIVGASLVFVLWSYGMADGQRLIRGMVVDSLTLQNIPGVSVAVKNSTTGASGDRNGVFAITVHPEDILVFSAIGYKTTEVKAQIDDEIMFVRMQEASILLNEVVIRERSYKYIKKTIDSPTLSRIKPLRSGEGQLPAGGGVGVAVNFAYFTKEETEKRKLVAVLEELERVKVYESIVNDPDFKYDILEKYGLSEERYFELLAMFNQDGANSPAIHSGNDVLILYELHRHFGQEKR